MLSRKFRKSSEENKRAYDLLINFLGHFPFSENYTKEILWSHDGHYTMASAKFKDRVEAEIFSHSYLKNIVEGSSKEDRENYFTENEHLFSIETSRRENELTAVLTFPVRLLSDERIIEVQRIIFNNGLDRINIDQNRSRLM